MDRDALLVEEESPRSASSSGATHSRGYRVRLGLPAAVVLALCGAVVTRSWSLSSATSFDSSPAFLVDKAAEVALKDEDAKTDNKTANVKAKDEKEEEELKLDPAVIKNAEGLLGKATDLKGKSDDLEEKSKGVNKDADNLQKKADAILKKAGQQVEDAEKKASKSKDLQAQAIQVVKDAEKKAAEMKKEASDLDNKAALLKQQAAQEKQEAAQKQQKVQEMQHEATSLQTKADTHRQAAVDTEEKAMGEIASQRMCLSLGGVRLKGGKVVEFPPVVGELNIADDIQCKDWCLKHTDCKQSVWSWESKTCEMFSEASPEPISFKDRWPWYNSTYCGGLDEKDAMLDMLHKVYDAKPWVPPPHNCSWSGDNCIDTKCCADVCRANFDFTKFDCYTCYKRDEYYAGCQTGPAPGGWDGTVLGGHPNYEIDPAPEGKLIQGVRLFCFTVVMWNQPPKEGWMNSEGEIVNHWKEAGKNILQCDDYNFFDGLEGGSEHNIHSFVEAWKKVKDDGRWRNNDWTIKVDGDAVFFPDHFRQKVMYNWKTPQGSTVYMRNTFYKFQFMGALEAMTREAMEIFADRSWECEVHLTQEGGEDYWTEQCLEGLGIDFQTDVGLLHDKYAADENCNDPNGVAHHFFKKTSSWDYCWEAANNAWNNARGQ